MRGRLMLEVEEVFTVEAPTGGAPGVPGVTPGTIGGGAPGVPGVTPIIGGGVVGGMYLSMIPCT